MVFRNGKCRIFKPVSLFRASAHISQSKVCRCCARESFVFSNPYIAIIQYIKATFTALASTFVWERR